MSERTPLMHVSTLELPSTAPQVRVTAGLGSAAQKTWNLKRPVTLVGSRRPAHIVLHDRDISNAHCVIVNTGAEVLLKDLHTSAGTLCNNTPVDLTLLKDGDVIGVGTNRIQVAIHVPENACNDSACGVEFADPTKFPTPVSIGLVHTDQQWKVAEAVALIGRHDTAAILLDHEEVSRRHALIFRFRTGPAIFDLGGRGGIRVNGQQSPLAALCEGDRITVGPFGLRVGLVVGTTTENGIVSPGTTCDSTATPNEKPGQNAALPPPPPRPTTVLHLESDPATGVTAVESELDALQQKIAGSWDRLNAWQSQLLTDAGALNKQESSLATREAEVDARDAALRGQLYDVTRYHEELTQRERELEVGVARLQAERDKLEADREACTKREADTARRLEELPRREHVLAQRWGRLLAATCPHCGKPIGTGEGGAKNPGS